MYPMTCAGGYPVPIKGGRFEVIGFKATVNTTTSDSRVTLMDDPFINEGDKQGRILTASYADRGTKFIDVKGMADIDANLEVLFPEPMKIRNGVSLIRADNVVPGSMILYIK